METQALKIELQHISKRFGEQVLFDNLDLVLEAPCSLALLGINGSGKSTLLQIIGGYMNPSRGQVVYSIDGRLLAPDEVYRHVSVCAPYLELIEEMTLKEFLGYHAAFKPMKVPVDDIIQRIGLEKARDKWIEKFSSGMKQRVKLAQAFFADTSLLLLDEPCTNLDEDGIRLYHDLFQQESSKRIVVVASNDQTEYQMCGERVQVG